MLAAAPRLWWLLWERPSGRRAAGIAWPLGLRIVFAVALTPAGMLMGIPLPAGVRSRWRSLRKLIAWAWGMNGALGAGRDAGGIHRDELGLFGDAGVARRFTRPRVIHLAACRRGLNLRRSGR